MARLSGVVAVSMCVLVASTLMAEFAGATPTRFSPVCVSAIHPGCAPSTAIRTVLQRGEGRRQELTACVIKQLK